VHRLALLTGLVLTTVVAGVAARAAEPVPPNRVTMITDSVGGVLFWLETARKELARGLDFHLETKTCRKLVKPGCPAYGDPSPPSALETIGSLGPELGPTVVIDVGYNDQPDEYSSNLDEVMRALVDARVQHVVWVTLEETRDVWAEINPEIEAAPKRWPQLVVADWASFSAGKPWFDDGVHMTDVGGAAFAEFLRPFVLDACGAPCAPPPPLQIVTGHLPTAHVRRPYAATLLAAGGAPPYRWSVGGLPRGLHLSSAGRLTGIPKTAGVYPLTVGVRDDPNWEDEALARVTLRVRR
jgi:hypothetical protein